MAESSPPDPRSPRATDAPEVDAPTRASDAPLLFCPFCRECYEGEATCPVHELPLVDFIDLPKQAHERAVIGADDPVAPWEPRFGRAWIATGALAALVAFFLPIASATSEAGTAAWTGLEFANGPAPNLWSLPFTAVLFVIFLYRRTTPNQMRGARLAAILLALTPAASLLYSMRNVARGVTAAHGAVALSWGPGLYVGLAASLVLLIGAVRFGVMPGGSALPHGAASDEAPARGIDTGVAKKTKRRRR